jgi:hypothetical protein
MATVIGLGGTTAVLVPVVNPAAATALPVASASLVCNANVANILCYESRKQAIKDCELIPDETHTVG